MVLLSIALNTMTVALACKPVWLFLPAPESSLIHQRHSPQRLSEPANISVSDGHLRKLPLSLQKFGYLFDTVI